MPSRAPRLLLLICVLGALAVRLAAQSPGPRFPVAIAVESSANPITVGSAVSLSAIVGNVDDSGPAPTGRVDFYDGLVFIGSGDLMEVDGRMRASLRIPALAEGIHPITARYLGDDAHLDSQSEPLVQTVTPATN